MLVPCLNAKLQVKVGNKLMMMQVEFMGKVYLCTVMSDWVDMIEELDGGGVLDENDPLWPLIANKALEAFASDA
jgi:hypothetical protein